jgi:DNA-binding response OmpR family regulator
MDTKKKILVIDDEVDLSLMISFQFTAKGFEVQTAENGVEALAKIGDFRPDLVILDINMPKMGGIEFYSKICGPNGRPVYPVMVLTARANVKTLFADLHIDGFMIKPFEIDGLVQEAELIMKKQIVAVTPPRPKSAAHPRRICIAQHDQAIFNELCGGFLSADCIVIPARSGAIAIEQVMTEVPDMAIIDLGLTDIPGDVVIFRLSQMCKTMGVTYILTSSKAAEREHKVMERLGEKNGINKFIVYNDAAELQTKIQELF